MCQLPRCQHAIKHAECKAGPDASTATAKFAQTGRSKPRADFDATNTSTLTPGQSGSGASQFGAGRFQVTQNNGRRCSTAAAYLRPAQRRANLDIITEATVARVLERSRAVGIELHRHGEHKVLRADKEIILSAGAYNSPQLRMLSGIGKADDLKAVGVHAQVDLPVGYDLQDRPGLVLSYFTDTPTLFHAGTDEDVRLFQECGRGPLSSNISEGGGFFRTGTSSELPDVMFNSGPVRFYEESLGSLSKTCLCSGPLC